MRAGGLCFVSRATFFPPQRQPHFHYSITEIHHAEQPGLAELLFGLMHVQTNARKMQSVFKEMLSRVLARACGHQNVDFFYAWGKLVQGRLLHGARLADTLDPETNHVYRVMFGCG